MKVWQINTPEATPVDGDVVRLRRSGLLAQALVDRGHELTWWSAAFFHATKTYRFQQDTTIDYADRYRLRFIYGPGYSTNKSLARAKDHRIVARKFLRQAEGEACPDLIICSCPTLELSVAAVDYGRRHGVPVVLDVRDLWPDIFMDAVPPILKPIAKCCLWPYRRLAAQACSGASAILGNTEAFVEWGLRQAGRQRTDHDRHFPFGYSEPEASETELNVATDFWKAVGVETRPDRSIICFFGTVGHQFDFDTVIAAGRRVSETRDVLFVLCGEGDLLAHYRDQVSDCRQFVLPGWVNGVQIWRLMQMSRLALAPYNNVPNFRSNLTNKPIEYLAGGLPILTSLTEGVLVDLLSEHQCGLSYGDDPTRLTGVINELLDSPESCRDMARNARALFERRYIAKNTYREMAIHLEAIALKQKTTY